jgi:cytochrome P450
VTAPPAPGPIDAYRGVRGDILTFLTQLARDQGDFVFFRVLAFPYLLVNDPALLKEALVDRSEELIIKGGASAGLAKLIGHGILTNRGDDWRKSRAALTPLFTQSALKSHLATVDARIEESLGRWRDEFTNRAVPMHLELLALSIRITCSTLFGYPPRFDEADRAAAAITTLQREGMERFLAGTDYLSWLPTPLNQRIAAATQELRTLAQRAIASGSEQTEDEILSVLFAGTESPVNTLCFALKLLDEAPEWKAKLALELKEAPGPEPWEHIDRVDVLAQVLAEAQRLYPAGWAFERWAKVECTLGGQRVPKGTRLMFSPYVLHRNPRHWNEPERFDPTRFRTSPFVADGVAKHAYLPFGAGPRSCIGSRLAWIEMRRVLAALVSRCEWSPSGQPLTAEGSFKIRLSHPMELKLRVS